MDRFSILFALVHSIFERRAGRCGCRHMHSSRWKLKTILCNIMRSMHSCVCLQTPMYHFSISLLLCQCSWCHAILSHASGSSPQPFNGTRSTNMCGIESHFVSHVHLYALLASCTHRHTRFSLVNGREAVISSTKYGTERKCRQTHYSIYRMPCNVFCLLCNGKLHRIDMTRIAKTRQRERVLDSKRYLSAVIFFSSLFWP